MAAARTLPGIRFVTAAPPLTEFLPRMDIAVFVGFASRGPLDTPVAIEDVEDFAVTFGGEAPLAWDEARGVMLQAHLAPAVRAFFRNGGTRCWVVRVAGPAVANFFPLPGVIRLDGDTMAPAFARATSPGSWSDGLRVGTALAVRALDVSAVRLQRNVLELDVETIPANVPVTGDVIRLRTATHVIFLPVTTLADGPVSSPPSDRRTLTLSGTPVWFRLAAPPSGIAPGAMASVYTAVRTPVASSETFAATVPVIGFVADDGSGAAALDVRMEITDAPEPGALVSVDVDREQLWLTVHDVGLRSDGPDPASDVVRVTGAAMWRLRDAPSSMPGAVIACDGVRLDLWVRETESRSLRAGDLGLSPAHPRYWGRMPDDQARRASDAAASVREAASVTDARFPLAGTGSLASVYLPVDVPTVADRLLSAVRQPGSALERDGLATYSAALFLDPALAAVRTDSLMDAADHLRWGQATPRRLRGLHAALGIEEATIVVVADACHPGWSRPADVPPAPPAPSDPLARPEWWHARPCDPPAPIPLAPEPPFGEFLDCGIRVIPRPHHLRRLDASASGTYTLAWDVDEPARSILEESRARDFSDAVAVYSGDETRLTLYGRADGTYYYRVRAVAGTQTSDWSDGLAIRVGAGVSWRVRPGDEYAHDTLLAVHRALLRAAAARGDLFALMALPRHFREPQVLEYVETLKRSPERIAIPPLDAAEESSPPLITSEPFSAAERRAFSYGAIHHPWLFVTDGQAPDGARLLPPDGAMAGLLAGRSLARGAWIAPANEPLRGVIALAPAISPAGRAVLAEAQVNVVSQEPRGFLTLSADTLSAEPDLVPIGVRRLLSLLRRLALREGMTYVFEPNDAPFRRLVQRGFEGFLSHMFERGAFAGPTAASAFRVVTSGDVNTPQSLDQGRFIVELKVAPAQPLKFLTVRLVQSGDRALVVEE
jgi:hypothetical protein